MTEIMLKNIFLMKKEVQCRKEMAYPPSARLATGRLLVSNARIQLKIVGGSDVGISVLFREVFSHPYISFFHLLVNGFCVLIMIFNFKIFSLIF